MIDKLTPEQTAKFPFYVKKWIDIGLSTEPCNFNESCESAKMLYKVTNLKEPTKFHGPYDNPLQAAEEILKHYGKEVNAENIKEEISYMHYGSHDAYWLSFYDFVYEELDLDISKDLSGLIKMAQSCGWWSAYEDECFFQHRPEEIHTIKQIRDGQETRVLHNLDGPAIKFRGEDRRADVYAIRGIRVKKKVIDRTFTVDDIDKEQNVEIRRIMMELYGLDKYINDADCKIVAEDVFGTLYRRDFSDDESLMMIRVTNSTPEPDGHFKDYYLRVDPNAYGGLKTPLQAIASTWRRKDNPREMLFNNPEDYVLEKET